jgi:hypothetical protein
MDISFCIILNPLTTLFISTTAIATCSVHTHSILCKWPWGTLPLHLGTSNLSPVLLTFWSMPSLILLQEWPMETTLCSYMCNLEVWMIEEGRKISPFSSNGHFPTFSDDYWRMEWPGSLSSEQQ